MCVAGSLQGLLNTLYSPEQLCPPRMNNGSQPLQFITWACFPIITASSGPPAFHFSMFICAQQMPSPCIRHWTSRCVCVTGLRLLTFTPLSHLQYGHGGAVCLRMWESQFISMLLRWDSDGCQSPGCHKAPHLTAIKSPSNDVEIGVGSAGLNSSPLRLFCCSSSNSFS